MGAKHRVFFRGQIRSLTLEIIIHGVQTNLHIYVSLAPFLYTGSEEIKTLLCRLSCKIDFHCICFEVVIYTTLSMVKQCTLSNLNPTLLNHSPLCLKQGRSISRGHCSSFTFIHNTSQINPLQILEVPVTILTAQ